jgi:uncharacterized protein (TIGR00290 family)
MKTRDSAHRKKSKKITLLSWSSGKDCAWALHVLRQQPDIEVVGLFCTVNQEFSRVAMHAVRIELLQQQAESVGLPIHIINIPHPCSNEQYEAVMGKFIKKVKQKKIKFMAFGDIFLEDVRQYRENKLAGTGIEPLFPLWGIPTDQLSQEMVNKGLRAQITCVDPKVLSPEFVGFEYSSSFLERIPKNVDPCGERGEFHTFAFDGPIFNKKIIFTVGEVVHRDGFVFVDLLPGEHMKIPGSNAKK